MIGSTRQCGLVATLLLVSSAGFAQDLTDDFESYANGSQLEGQRGWEAWDQNPQNRTTVNQTFAFSGTQSVAIRKNADTIHQFDHSCGKWTISAQVYIPTGNGGSHWFILLDEYNHGMAGAKQWGGQVEFNNNAGAGEVQCDCGGVDNFVTNIKYDQWTEIRCELDLDADFAEIYYDGVLLGSWIWSTGTDGVSDNTPIGFEAVDLYAQTGAMSLTYFDDVKVVANGDCDGGTVYCDETQNPNNAADIAISTLDSSQPSIVVSLSNGPVGEFCYLLVGNGNNTVSQPPGANGDLCVVGGNCLGRYDKDIFQIDGAGAGSTDIKSPISLPCDGTGGVSILPGSTWNWQFWHRQPMGNPATFSSALATTFH